MHIHPLITDSESLLKLCERLAKVRLRDGRHRIHAREYLLAGSVPGADRQYGGSRGDRSEGRGDRSHAAPHLLVNKEDVLKVVHAGGQDLEIIFNLTGGTPHPLFDTQVAAMALGLGEQVGYSNLVESLIGKSLDKGAALRLGAAAAGQAPDRLCDRRRHSPRHALSEDAAAPPQRPAAARGSTRRWSGSATPATMPTIRPGVEKGAVQSRKPEVLGRLKAAAAWREIEARSKNLPAGGS
jgi:ribonuclease D